jgi:glutamyl-tRNA reductase
MILLAVGCSFQHTGVELRERLAFDAAGVARALDDLTSRYGCEAVILTTCNRVELYLARPGAAAVFDAGLLGEFLAEHRGLPAEEVRQHLYEHAQADAVRHLFRVAAGLDSMIVGEAQIAGQVKRAYETAQGRGAVGPALHALFRHARLTAKRVRTETGLTRGHASVASAAVDYVRQVFEHFGDKTVLVIGAGKMGALTLRHLGRLGPRRIWVTNRSPAKAEAVARGCGGRAVPWEELDNALARADIVLSTTGAPEPVVSLERYRRLCAGRPGKSRVILDIAVPRDFDPCVNEDDGTYLFNIDDLMRIRARTLQDRQRHIAPAEAIVEQEQRRFWKEWARRSHGPTIASLTRDLETKRKVVVAQLLARLNGRLTDADKEYVEGAFRLLQNQFLHGPISALIEETHAGPEVRGGHTLLEALRKLFRIQD